ncbi:hypothetical protein ON010_g18823 [Phytophthora cinnamomi]|nr:hypothetical protein ON010_g18823 [Phytophthora cinnamomi]
MHVHSSKPEPLRRIALACLLSRPETSSFKRSSGWPAWGGDESLPPGTSSDPEGKFSPNSTVDCSLNQRFVCSTESNSPEPNNTLHRRSRSRSKLEPSSSFNSRRGSAVSSHVRRLSLSRSRSPSATRTARSTQNSQELRRSCAFFEDKARAQAEVDQLTMEAAERLERARQAAPPQKLLERQALATQRKSQQLKKLEREMNAELAREKRAKARDVPLTTYLSADDAAEAEQKRKERIRQRAEDMMQAAELPPRMAVASKNAISDASPAGEAGSDVGNMTVKLKKKLRAAAEAEAEKLKRRPKPVPNFDQLHSKNRGRRLRDLIEEEVWGVFHLTRGKAG